MIKEAKGNLLQADAEALVNTVNCVGFMGKGIALQFKQAWPENFEVYTKACAAKLVQPGKMFVFETGRMVNPKYIINFPTKRHWRGKSRMEDIRSGLKALISEVRERRIQSIAVPPLGCGNGGLNWWEVKPLITKAFAEVPSVEVLLFAHGHAWYHARQILPREKFSVGSFEGRAAKQVPWPRTNSSRGWSRPLLQAKCPCQ